jgi:hypothetical protein
MALSSTIGISLQAYAQESPCASVVCPPIGGVKLMSALPLKADIGRAGRDVRFVPKADISSGFEDAAANALNVR